MKALLSCFLCLALATSATAGTMTVSTLREAVSERDFVAVDDGLSQNHAAYLKGNVAADQMRALFIALSSSEPGAVTFVEDWLARDPDDPKAQIARAWSLYNAALEVRQAGNMISLEFAQGLFEAAYELSYSAYESDPTLVPASDAMVRGFADRPIRGSFSTDALQPIQSEHPNWGSIKRSLHNVARMSAPVTRGYCKAVSADFPADEAAVMEHRCLMTAAIDYRRTALRAYVEEHLWDDADPVLTVPRLTYFLTDYEFADATQEQIDWAKSALMTYPADQFELTTMAWQASMLESKLNSQHGDFYMFALAFRKARLPLAESYLKHDPYNLALLDIVEGVAFEGDVSKLEKADGTISFSIRQPELTQEERKNRAAAQAAQKADFKKRRLFGSPYHSDFWLDYARFAGNAGDPHTIFKGDGAMQNAIIYSDDKISILTQAISDKQLQYFKFTQFDGLADEQKAEMPAWQTLWQETNMTETILCPYLRARTVRDQICPYFTADGKNCDPAPFDAEPQSIALHEKAMKAPECAGILASTIDELWYEEVPFSKALLTSE